MSEFPEICWNCLWSPGKFTTVLGKNGSINWYWLILEMEIHCLDNTGISDIGTKLISDIPD